MHCLCYSDIFAVKDHYHKDDYTTCTEANLAYTNLYSMLYLYYMVIISNCAVTSE
jgi:hypothetical protein